MTDVEEPTYYMWYHSWDGGPEVCQKAGCTSHEKPEASLSRASAMQVTDFLTRVGLSDTGGRDILE